MRLLSLTLLGVGCAAVLGGCGRDAQESTPATPETGGTLRIATLEPFGFFSPVVSQRPGTRDFMHHVTPPLGRLNERGRVEFVAARGWRDAGMRLDFILRPLRWDDGQPVTARDFVLTSRVMLDPGTPGRERARFDLVQDVVATNDTVLTFHYLDLHPHRYQKALLMPLPRHVLGDAPDARELQRWPITERPLSCGPFRVVETGTWKVVLERNDDSGFDPPRLDRVEVRSMKIDEALQRFRGGTVDVIEDAPVEALDGLRDVRGKRIVALVGRSYVFMGWNLRDGRFADRSVRQAVAHAVDSARLIADLTLGQGDVARGPMVPAMGVRDTTSILGHDPEAARQLLERAGWSERDGVRERRGQRLSFHILVPEDTWLRRRAAEGIVRDLQAVGIRARVSAVPLETFLTRLESGQFEAYMGHWFPSLDFDLEPIWHSESLRFNYGGYANPRVDSLLSRLRYEAPSQWRQSAIHDLQQTIYDDQPYLFLFQPPKFVVFSERVQGARPNLISSFWNLPEWWIPRALQDAPAGKRP